MEGKPNNLYNMNVFLIKKRLYTLQWTLETDAIAWLRFLAWVTLAPPTGKRHSAICSKSRELAVLKTARRERQKIPDMFQFSLHFCISRKSFNTSIKC